MYVLHDDLAGCGPTRFIALDDAVDAAVERLRSPDFDGAEHPQVKVIRVRPVLGDVVSAVVAPRTKYSIGLPGRHPEFVIYTYETPGASGPRIGEASPVEKAGAAVWAVIVFVGGWIILLIALCAGANGGRL